MASVITVVTAAGAQPTDPQIIRDTIEADVSSTNPGYTANLPLSLIEDVLSTMVAGVFQMDSAYVETINSLTPYLSNPFLLGQLGQVYGVPQGAATNTSVNLVFSENPGYFVQRGLIVSDGAHQYTVQDGGAVGSAGTTAPLYAVATVPGSWAVPAGTVTEIATSLPSTSVLAVTNPVAGTPASAAQSEADYRAAVILTGRAPSQGMPTYVKSYVSNPARCPGVVPRLVSMAQTAAGWVVLAGGGDPYQVAGAIFQSMFDVSTLQPSVINVTAITKANPGVVTTDLTHGLATGQANVYLSGVLGMTAANGGPYTVTVIDAHTFSFGVNTTSFGTYTSGGTVTPNSRNVSVSIEDYPNTYTVAYVQPLQQQVTIQLTWNTNSPNYVSVAAVQQAGQGPLASYVNSIPVGSPLNLFELQNTFQLAVASLIPTPFLIKMLFTVSIDGSVIAPAAGTGVISGDPQSYFTCASSSVTINQG